MIWILVIAFLLFLVVGLIIYFIFIYNGLVRLSRNIEKAWANINVLLKQRYDEIPKLIKVCEGYMKYEKETLEEITSARTACLQANTIGESSKAEGELSKAFKSLFAVAENYPDLKTNQNFVQLQQRVSYLESQIADRREYFNDSTNNYNVRINQIPDMFVAQMLQMKVKELFEISAEERKDVDIKFNFPE